MPVADPEKPFRYEFDLVAAFAGALGAEGSKNILAFCKEFDYLSGRTDLVGVCKKDMVHAYEAKLTDWKRALHQARRNTCFAHFSYVVMPKIGRIDPKKRLEFEKCGVGLIVVGSTRPRVAIRAQKQEPFMPWLTNTAKKAALSLHSSHAPSSDS